MPRTPIEPAAATSLLRLGVRAAAEWLIEERLDPRSVGPRAQAPELRRALLRPRGVGLRRREIQLLHVGKEHRRGVIARTAALPKWVVRLGLRLALGSILHLAGLDVRVDLARHDHDAVGVTVQDVSGAHHLAIERDRVADIHDVEVGVRHHHILREVAEAERAHLVHITQAAIGDHPCRAEARGQGRHDLARQRHEQRADEIGEHPDAERRAHLLAAGRDVPRRGEQAADERERQRAARDQCREIARHSQKRKPRRWR